MKNWIKRGLSFSCSILLLFWVFAFISYAATPNYSVSGGIVTVGSDITVNVTLSASSNAAGGNFTLQYDNAKLTPRSYTAGSLVSGYTNNCNLSYSSNSIRFTFSGTKAITSSGTVVSIKFTGKASGSAALSFSANKLYDINGSAITSSASGNSVTVNDVPSSYTVTYNPNGGSVSATNATVTAGNSVTLPTPTKSYKITYNANNGTGAPSAQTVSLNCKGWATSSTATSANYSCGASYKPSGNVTLYAVWTSPVSATLSSTKPSRSGYSFLGWSTSSSATSATYIAGSSMSLDGNKTLYAVWKADPTPTTYTLTYNANGGSGAPSSQSGNGAITLSSARPTRSGYTFLGWSTSSSATVATYAPGASFNLTSNTTLYAVWSNPPATNDPSIQIRNYIPRREEAYRTTITFTAETLNAPVGATVHWYLNGQEVYTGDQYTVSQATSDYSIQIKLVSSGGSVLAESNIENITINNSFFARLIAFFRTLFGSLPVISQSMKETL